MTTTDALTRHALRTCFASCLLLAGCLTSRQHCVVNAGEEVLSDVTVACRQGTFNHGYLVPGAHKSYTGSLKLARGEAVHIRWTGPGGTRHDVSLTLRRHPGSRQVVFTLSGNGVVLSYGERQPANPRSGHGRPGAVQARGLGVRVSYGFGEPVVFPEAMRRQSRLTP